MKIQCQSCQAKYTIADEKVLGKVVKIRCKKCSATIVINGNEHQPHADDGADAGALDYGGASNDQWTVNVADGDQRTLTVAEIAAEYGAGVINDETFCWKDGMADWLPLREIEQLHGAVAGGGAVDVAVSKSLPPQQPAAAPLFAAAAPAADSPFAGHANGNGSAALFGGGGAAAAEAHGPAAARRAGGRAQGADLFGNVEKAGGEDDVMTSAATGSGASAAPGAPAVDEKLTGQRNESSVLFSLSALTESKKDTPANRTTAAGDGSGLIDIRALSATMDAGEKKKEQSHARVDDIMNLSGGGAFGAALAAPILAPPPLETGDMGGTSGSPKQNKTLVFAILGGCAFIAVAIVAAVALTRGSGDDAAKTAATVPSTTETAAAEPTAAAAPTETVAANPTPAPAPTGDTPAQPGTGVAKAPSAPAAKAAAVAAAPKEHTAAAAPAPEPPKAPAQPKSLNDALNDAVGKKAETRPTSGGGGTAPFDRGAAAASIGAVNVQSCKKPDGPTGSGHVQITFSPDGSVQSAVIDGGPYPGTTVGGCIAGKYRGARVPAFAGAPVKVGKSFTIN